MKIDIKINEAYLPYLNCAQATQIFFGGSSSGKSFFIAQKIVIDNLQGVNWLCCRNIARTIRNSVFNEIIKCISSMGISSLFNVNRSDMVITNKMNNKQILFVGLDDPEKVKSLTPAEGVLERIFVEEATEIKKEAYLQLKRRLRGLSDKPKHIILAFNPILKSHWLYKDFFGRWEDNKKSYTDDKLLILKTTYKDNAFLTSEDIKLLEDESDSYFYNVYTLGNWGVLGHVIFKNWKVEDLSGVKDSFDNLYYGCDFGYSSDPNAAIKFHYDRKHKKIYILDEIYKTGMSDEELSQALIKFVGQGYVTCDRSQPKTIDYLCSRGVRAVPAVQGADSINRGIRWLQGNEIIIDVRCQNFKNEIEQYHWLEDKYGNAMAKAADINNHLLDALRYGSEDLQFDNELKAVRRI